MPAFGQRHELTAEGVAREAHALAKVLRLLGHSSGRVVDGTSGDDPELARWAVQLDDIAREPGQLDASLMTLDRALALAEQTVRRLKREVQGSLPRRINRLLSHSEDESDPVHLADELVQRLQEQHRVIASQLGR